MRASRWKPVRADIFRLHPAAEKRYPYRLLERIGPVYTFDRRSVDLRGARLEGASINAAKISGAYFPQELSASEIELSLLHGTRMRYRSKP